LIRSCCWKTGHAEEEADHLNPNPNVKDVKNIPVQPTENEFDDKGVSEKAFELEKVEGRFPRVSELEAFKKGCFRHKAPTATCGYAAIRADSKIKSEAAGARQVKETLVIGTVKNANPQAKWGKKLFDKIEEAENSDWMTEDLIGIVALIQAATITIYNFATDFGVILVRKGKGEDVSKGDEPGITLKRSEHYQAGDYLILASPGFLEAATVEEAAARLQELIDAGITDNSVLAAHLANAAYRYEKGRDITVMVCRIS